MRPIALADWIEVDARLGVYLDEKARLEAADLPTIFRAERGTGPAQQELLDILVGNLVAHQAETHRRDGDRIELPTAGRTIDLGADGPPLLTASRLVQEDICLMRRTDEGWRLAAAALAFPSSWRLADKIGRPMNAIHAPVPGFAGRMDQMVTRIFDNLAPSQPVERFNWSLYDDDRLHHPEPHPKSWRGTDGLIDPARVHVRVERQTLIKLPRSGDIAFTIRVHQGPATLLAGTRSGRLLADDLDGLDGPQRAYKGWSADADDLIALFRGGTAL
ncbi:MAG: DUF3445 domain-containing protein [Phreatobacter sp.]|nr:DUF3445 domain-containing protein [Phreatobacter sp.]